MRLRLAIASLAMLVATAASAAPPAPPNAAQLAAPERRVALLIGNDKYEGSPLTNPSRDVTRVAGVLRDLGFYIVGGGPLLDLDKAGMDKALREFRAYLGPGTVAFFYFSGHGMAIRDNSYLVPIGANGGEEGNADVDFVNARAVVEMLGSSGSRLSILVLDACRVMIFKSSMREKATAGLASLNAPNGVLIAYSTQPGNVASDGDPNAASGPYSSALIGQMQAPGMSFIDVFNKTGLAVSRSSNGVQRPWLAISPIDGDFYFTPPGAPPGKVAPPAHVVPPRPPLPVSRDCADCPEMVALPPGNFVMGADREEPDELPPHEVAIARQFAIGRYEVTFAEWDQCVAGGGCATRADDSRWGRGRQPVINVSWEDAQQYVAWLSQRTGKQYRLPSEAEWEYAAQGGQAARGGLPLFGFANCYGCGSDWDHKQTGPVGSFRPNAYGLYDMLGNVWEWVADCAGANYIGAPGDGSAKADGACRRHGLRGGSWADPIAALRVTNRGGAESGTRNFLVGFRIARD